MIMTMPKWRVDVVVESRSSVARTVTLWMYDAHIENVTRAVAGMQFSEDGLDRVTSITIALVKFELQQGTASPRVSERDARDPTRRDQ